MGTVSGKYVMMSFPEPTCRANEQWAGVRHGRLRSNVWMRAADDGRSAGAGTSSLGRDRFGPIGRRRDLHAQLEEAGAVGIITSQWPGSYGTTRVFNAYNRETPTFELGCEDYSLVLPTGRERPGSGASPDGRIREPWARCRFSTSLARSPARSGRISTSCSPPTSTRGKAAPAPPTTASGSVLMMETMRILK